MRVYVYIGVHLYIRMYMIVTSVYDSVGIHIPVGICIKYTRNVYMYNVYTMYINVYTYNVYTYNVHTIYIRTHTYLYIQCIYNAYTYNVHTMYIRTYINTMYIVQFI